MVEGIGHKPTIGGYGSTGGVGGDQNVSQTQGKPHPQGTRFNDQFKTERFSKIESTSGAGNTPQIDFPTVGSSNTQEIADSIIDKLGKLSTDDAGKGLFVLYKLLTLLQEAMNEMQKSMQVMRQAETNVVIANIESEANEMEDAAKFGLWMGVISGIVQIGASAFSMAGGIKGAASAGKGLQTGHQMKVTQQELTAMKANPQAKQADIEIKQLEYGGLKAKLDITTNAAQTRAARVQSIGQFIGSFAQFFKAIGDGISGIKQADAKRIEGQIKQMEEDASKTADLTKSIKDMITALLQLMQTVNRNEIDTNAQIFRGI